MLIFFYFLVVDILPFCFLEYLFFLATLLVKALSFVFGGFSFTPKAKYGSNETQY